MEERTVEDRRSIHHGEDEKCLSEINENRLVTNFSTYSYRRVDVRICTAKAYEKSLLSSAPAQVVRRPLAGGRGLRLL